MFRALWKARREITALIDDVLKAAEDRQITKEEVEKLTSDIVAVVNRIKGGA